MNEEITTIKELARSLNKLLAMADRDPVDVLLDNMDFKTRNSCEQIDGDLYYSQDWEECGKRGRNGDTVKAVRVKLDGMLDTHEITLTCRTYPTDPDEPDDYEWLLEEEAL